MLEEPRAGCKEIETVSNNANEVKNKCWPMNGIRDEISFAAENTD
jgi:hypothetical protein